MSKPIAIKAEKQSANDEFIIIHEWLVDEGQKITKETPIAEAEASKSTYQIMSPADGYIRFRAETEKQIDIGAAVAWIGDAPEFLMPDKNTSSTASEKTKGSRITRKALKLIKEKSLRVEDFDNLEKVTEADVLSLSGKTKKQSDNTVAQPAGTTKLFEISGLSQVWSSIIPSQIIKQFPYSVIYDKVKQLGNKVTLGEYVLYGCSRILKDYPLLNAYYTDKEIHIYKGINISLAINVNKGLRVPVIHRTDQMEILEISKRVKELALSYMREELTQDDQTGGSFTISDLSSLKISSFNPILNQKQSAILGICSKDIAADYFNVILAFDHRVLDGLIAAQFLNTLEDFLIKA